MEQHSQLLNSQRSSGRYWKSQILKDLPSRELTYPTKQGKKNHWLKSAVVGNMLVPRRINTFAVFFKGHFCFTRVWPSCFFVFFWGSCWFFGPFWPRWSRAGWSTTVGVFQRIGRDPTDLRVVQIFTSAIPSWPGYAAQTNRGCWGGCITQVGCHTFQQRLGKAGKPTKNIPFRAANS